MQQRTIGFILIIVGILLMVYTGFNYVTHEKVVDIGPIKIEKEVEHRLPWSPIIGGVLFIGGLLLVVRDHKHRA
ncbi:MAG: hypothetical protein V4649_02920 [Bacteroidota bacterium]